MKIRFVLIALMFIALLMFGLLAVGREAVEFERRQIDPTYFPEIEIPEEKPVLLGEFKITVYTPECDGGKWGYQTATGVKSTHLATCAVDSKVIPLGTVIDINGLNLTAVDTGSAVKGNVVDIFFDGSRGQALEWIAEFGTRHEVYLKGE